MTGIKAIWRTFGNKYYLILFTILWAISILLDLPLRLDFQFLISSLVLGGIIFFLVLALIALIPILWRIKWPDQKRVVAQSVLFLASALVAPLILLNSRVLASVFIFSGFAVWVVVQGILACALAYALSMRISVRSSHGLGWIFLVLALLVEVLLFMEAPRDPTVRFLLVFYTVAWLAPCILLALAKYHNPRLFSAYTLIALVYTVFPVAYRLLALLAGTAFPFGTLRPNLISLMIEEAITIALFIWALNAAGNLLVRRYRNLAEGRQQSVLRTSPENASTQLSIETRNHSGENHEEEREYKRQLVSAPFLIFGLLFSGLAYFAFVHARGPFGILEYLEPSIGFISSVLSAIPLLFYILQRRR